MQLLPDQTKHFSLVAGYSFGAQKGLATEVDAKRNMEIEWDRGRDSSVRRGFMIKLFQSKGIFDEFKSKHWVYFDTREGQANARSYIRLAEDYERFLEGDIAPSEETEEESEFAYETDLRDFLAQHLEKVEKGLALFNDGRGSGVEYLVEGGRIDLLTLTPQNDFLVIELKVSQGRNRTLGQLLYYMGWVQSNLAKGKRVRGAIVAKSIPDDLKLACTRVSDVSLFEYDLQVSLRPITQNSS